MYWSFRDVYSFCGTFSNFALVIVRCWFFLFLLLLYSMQDSNYKNVWSLVIKIIVNNSAIFIGRRKLVHISVKSRTEKIHYNYICLHLGVYPKYTLIEKLKMPLCVLISSSVVWHKFRMNKGKHPSYITRNKQHWQALKYSEAGRIKFCWEMIPQRALLINFAIFWTLDCMVSWSCHLCMIVLEIVP